MGNAEQKLEAYVKALTDKQLVNYALIMERDLEKQGPEDRQAYRRVLIAMNTEADYRWIDPETYTEGLDDRVSDLVDAGEVYARAVWIATH